MSEKILRAAVVIDDPLSPNRFSSRIAPRLRDRGYTALAPSPSPGSLFRDAEESAARAASIAGEFDVIGVGWGCTIAARLLTRHLFGRAVLVAPPLSRRLLRALPESQHQKELLDCALAVQRDAWLITGDLLIIWPGCDPDYPVRDVKRFLARLPDSDALILPGTKAADLTTAHLPAVFSRIFAFFDRQNPENACENPINVYNR